MIVTVVTPTLDAVTYLDECIRSVDATGGPERHGRHIVVDGGSTDGTVELARLRRGAKRLQGNDTGLYDADNKGTAPVVGRAPRVSGRRRPPAPGCTGCGRARYPRASAADVGRGPAVDRW